MHCAWRWPGQPLITHLRLHVQNLPYLLLVNTVWLIYPISNCLHSGITRIYVLTQFNSASLNKHIKNTYHFSSFSEAFVDILAAEQTPMSGSWYQGTADAVRQSLAPFGGT